MKIGFIFNFAYGFPLTYYVVCGNIKLHILPGNL